MMWHFIRQTDSQDEELGHDDSDGYIPHLAFRIRKHSVFRKISESVRTHRPEREV